MGVDEPRGQEELAAEDERVEERARMEARLDREDRLYERVLAVRNSLAATQKELDALASKIRVAHLSLERAHQASAWRFAHGVTRFLRKVRRRPGSRGSDAFDAAMARLAALEERSRPSGAR
jgi:hypothetical protein